MPPTYSAVEVCRASGATYRQVDYWTNSGLLAPVIPANGTGTRRRYDDAELDWCRTIVALLTLGVTLRAIRHAHDAGKVDALIAAAEHLSALVA